MAKPLSEEEKKQIILDYASGKTLTELSEKTGRSLPTLRKVLKQTTAEAEEKHIPSKNIEAYMSEKTPEVCRMIDLYLSAMCSPEKIEDATLSQLSHAFSSVVDKFLKDRGNDQKNVEVSLQVPEPWTK